MLFFSFQFNYFEQYSITAIICEQEARTQEKSDSSLGILTFNISRACFGVHPSSQSFVSQARLIRKHLPYLTQFHCTYVYLPLFSIPSPSDLWGMDWWFTTEHEVASCPDNHAYNVQFLLCSPSIINIKNYLVMVIIHPGMLIKHLLI